jgi:hypothetical protein
MPLNPFAVLAMEGSQVVAGVARLNCRQSHGRTASGALRPLVLPVEHVSLSRVGRQLYRTLITDNCRGRAVTEMTMLLRVADWLVTSAHFSKYCAK